MTVDVGLPVSWPARAGELQARPVPAADGIGMLSELWSGGHLSGAFDPSSVQRLGGYLKFAQVGAGSRLTAQDEPGDFMLIVLEGSVAIERSTSSGARARLAEARPGDVLGEMAVLDAGPRFSTCTTRGPCVLAVLELADLERLAHDDASLALALVTALARRLSLRLRQVSTRLSALLTDS
jgi:CRP-like cAMP-binding protein